MKYPQYMKEAIKVVKFGFETSRSVDGFLIKLESAISHIIENGGKNNVKSFLDILVEQGLLSKLACNKDDVKKILDSPRHSLLKNYSTLLYNALDKSLCIGGYRYVVPPPSQTAGHISWGATYRDSENRPLHFTYRKKSLGVFFKNYIVYLILIGILLLLLYSGYLAYINLGPHSLKISVLNTHIILRHSISKNFGVIYNMIFIRFFHNFSNIIRS